LLSPLLAQFSKLLTRRLSPQPGERIPEMFGTPRSDGSYRVSKMLIFFVDTRTRKARQDIGTNSASRLFGLKSTSGWKMTTLKSFRLRFPKRWLRWSCWHCFVMVALEINVFFFWGAACCFRTLGGCFSSLYTLLWLPYFKQ